MGLRLFHLQMLMSSFLISFFLSISTFCQTTRGQENDGNPVTYMDCGVNDFPLAQERSSLLAGNLWPNARIAYQFEPSFTDAQRQEFQKAVDEFHQLTCVRIEPKTDQDSGYIRVWTNLSNNSHCGVAVVCYSGNPQSVEFRWNCGVKFVIVHELLHALCLIHEQNRSDRDEYIHFRDCDNPSQIPPIFPNQINTGNLYDYLSQMHYPCLKCFGRPTMEGVTRCGNQVNTEGMSVLDADKINEYYGCNQGCHRHRWYNIQDLSPDKYADLVDFATEELDDKPVYVCRGYSVGGEISPGRFHHEEGICHLAFFSGDDDYSINITKRFQVFALPNGPNKITDSSAGYRLHARGPDGDGPTTRSTYLPVGRTVDNKKIYLAVTNEAPYRQVKTYVGRLYDKGANGIFPYERTAYHTILWRAVKCVS